MARVKCGMLIKLFLLFAIIPLVELYLLLKLASITGVATTIGLVVVTAIIGSVLAKSQGWLAWWRFRNASLAGRIPAAELVDGLLIAFAAALLLTPGLLTDTFGFALLIPTSRRWFRSRMMRYVSANVRVRFIGQPGPGGEPVERHSEIWETTDTGQTIDAEYRPKRTEKLDEPA
ncbi:MAG: FxsA family protein [Planctomycetaceae bacterium]|nr:MAG: FxsA family protein [Planctomycetaceae bacterium]